MSVDAPVGRPALVAADGVTPLRLPARPAANALGWGGGAWVAASGVAPELRDWLPVAGSPDGEAEGERGALVARARDLERNEGLIAGATQSLKDQAFGLGLDLQSMPAARVLGLSRQQAQDYANRIEDVWREWADDPLACDVTGQSTFGQLTRMTGGNALIAGEGLALPLWLPERQASRGSRFATVLQVIEPDRLSNPNDQPSGATLRDGVETDAYGAPVAYHIRKAHPGDALLGWPSADLMAWERVSAWVGDGVRRRQVLHVFDQKRPDQHRGVSWLAPVMVPLKQGGRYHRAELQAAVSSAAIMAVLETPLDGQTVESLFGDGKLPLDTVRDGRPVSLGIGPGGHIPRLLPGEKLTGFNAGRPSVGFDGFVTSVARHIAVGLGMTYETFVRDFSKTNYSSARASLLEGWRFILFLRLLLTTMWCRPSLELVLEEAVWRGYIDLPGFVESRAARRAWLRGVWRGPGRGWVDPVKEIQAAAMRVRLGLSTLRDEAFEQGRDLDELLDQIAAEREALAERGIVLPDVSFSPQPDPREGQASQD